jgi:hypothetical protein
MAFGLSGSKSKSTSESQGFSFGQSESRSVSDSISAARSGQDIAFGDIFEQFFGGASAAAGRVVPGQLAGRAETLFSGGMGFLDQLRGGADSDFLSARVSGESPVLGEQIGALGSDLGRFFREELNPAIGAQAAASGTLGGGRQGVAQGRAIDAVSREFQQGATALRAADIQARDQAAGTLGSQRIQSAAAGLGNLEGILGIGQQADTAELLPFQMLSGILGGPTTLTTSESMSVAQALSEAFGFDISEQSSKSKSKGSSAGIGF